MSREVRDDQHGTRTGYAYGCRCDDCRFANASHQRMRAAMGKVRVRRVDDSIHGTSTNYSNGCRCESCTSAATAAARALREQRRATTYSSTASRDEVKQWARGLGLPVAANLAGYRAELIIARYNREHPERPYVHPTRRGESA